MTRDTQIRRERELVDNFENMQEATQIALEEFGEDYPDAVVMNLTVWWNEDKSRYEYRISGEE